MIDIHIETVDALPGAAKALLKAAAQARVFLFYAPMGAGKTTLIKELCRQLGSRDSFSSPTYSIVNEYSYPGGRIFHFDLYRLKSSEELFDLGIEDYLQSGQYCFFEWPELVEDLVEDNAVKVEIEVNGNIRYLRATLF